ncbi:hypothetical protein [Chryseobacterium balustinum]|uniref:hypothetical protein n=1 Tax=Chryseobacterium balustinum TaxID=246 RepID=UPI001E4BBB87|nr:hypothetical protein [Chryseobacterium balustinum]
MKKIISCIVFLFSGTVIFGQGHYNGSSFNPNDYFAPHAGWIIPVWYGYANMDYYNAAGKNLIS